MLVPPLGGTIYAPEFIINIIIAITIGMAINIIKIGTRIDDAT